MILRQTFVFIIGVSLIALALCPAERVRAQIIVYEGFKYTPDTNPLTNMSPGLTNVLVQGDDGNFGRDWRRPGIGFSFATNAAGLICTNPVSAAQTQRGRYLVENVALCAECHTPKTDQGDYDRTQWLQGDVLDFKPVRLMPFAAAAPPIAGMPGFTDEQALTFFETGIDPTGKRAMYPMPQYRFNHDDAQAVLAYLRSLKR